ncbi:fructose bisphosphate aldolase [Sphingorhabdus arenilitoris]|uniref:fructose-bisphosphate aldolase n=1 Tax=Sphingorhabdus arenilitoris TaxID=1490041 RepID=A0ABV8RIZ5_9SPHN
MQKSEMMNKIERSTGFIAALDQSGGSTPKALAAYGIGADAFANEDEMFALIHEMRVRIMMSPAFDGDRILGAILFEKTMDGEAAGQSVPDYLKSKGIVPFLKVDQGLEEEANGVQLMKQMPALDALLQKGGAKGVFGTKMRSVINLANRDGISAIVKQQFDVAMQIISHGLMPIIEPEVNIKSAERGGADAILQDELRQALDKLPEDKQVMLKLSIPEQCNLYTDLIRHPRVLRLVALSGGYSTDEACQLLAENSGMIASFSRALLERLQHSQSDAEFNAALDSAIQQIYDTSKT